MRISVWIFVCALTKVQYKCKDIVGLLAPLTKGQLLAMLVIHPSIQMCTNVAHGKGAITGPKKGGECLIYFS